MSKIPYRNKHFRKDFSGQDLSGQDLSFTEFTACNFTNTNLSNANCSYSDFTGCILENTKCTRTNFANTCLACIFHPSDCYGMTLTLECRTFSEMRISRQWWYGFVFFALQMKPELEKGIDPRDGIITLLGQRYERLKELFARRQI